MFSPFKLNATLGRSYNADLDDTLRTKKALNKIGLFETPSYGMTEYPDEPLFQGIEKFQERHGLQKDGIMKPGGETATKLGQVLGEAGRRAPVSPAGSASLLSLAPDGSPRQLVKSQQSLIAATKQPAAPQNALQLASFTANQMPPKPGEPSSKSISGSTSGTSGTEKEKQVAAAIAPAIPLIGEVPSAISALLGMLGLSGLLKRDTPEETERERFCREQLEDDTEMCDAVWKKHGDAAAAKCRASAMERYANCLAGRAVQPLYKGAD